MEHSIGLTIRTLSNLLKRRMFETHPSPGGPPPTKMHAEIIDFLYQNRESVIFQRDRHFNKPAGLIVTHGPGALKTLQKLF